jgi:23S rRNA (adenine2503-C2)-methyltransferase
VSIEYALIRDVNDQADRADELGRVLTAAGRGAGWVHVNLIPLNPTPGSMWTASRQRDEKTFVRRLEAHGIAVTVRDTRGREIDGACGQLAAANPTSSSGESGYQGSAIARNAGRRGEGGGG